MPQINRHVKYIEASATSIDPTTHTVACESIICNNQDDQDYCDLPDNFSVDYDRLIVTVGAKTNTFNIPGVEEHCHFLKEVSDAKNIRTKLLNCFERASVPGISEEEKRRRLSFVIIGAGPAGLEFAAAKQYEDFGQTLAFWGVDSGPYFVLPFLGPSTVRDGLSVPVDWVLFDPVFRDKELKVTLSLLAVRYTDKRASLLQATNIIDETAPDKYAFIRDAYLQRRLYLIHDGNPPDTGLSEEELFSDDDLFKDDLDLEKDLK